MKDGATLVLGRAYARSDNLNITGITDQVTAANSATTWSNPANRLQNADGPWGSRTYYYDGVGNRTYENATVSGTTTSDNVTYSPTSNRLQSVIRGAATTRSFAHDAAGNLITDTRSSGTSNAYTYTYNKANRLKTV